MTTDPKTAELEGVIAMAALVEYQPGAVVSRTLVKKSAGTVTAFAFDAGEGLSEHTAPYDALVLMIEGDAEISIAGTAHGVGAGAAEAPRGLPHAVKALTRIKMDPGDDPGVSARADWGVGTLHAIARGRLRVEAEG